MTVYNFDETFVKIISNVTRFSYLRSPSRHCFGLVNVRWLSSEQVSLFIVQTVNLIKLFIIATTTIIKKNTIWQKNWLRVVIRFGYCCKSIRYCSISIRWLLSSTIRNRYFYRRLQQKFNYDRTLYELRTIKGISHNSQWQKFLLYLLGNLICFANRKKEINNNKLYSPFVMWLQFLWKKTVWHWKHRVLYQCSVYSVILFFLFFLYIFPLTAAICSTPKKSNDVAFSWCGISHETTSRINTTLPSSNHQRVMSTWWRKRRRKSME